MDGVYIPETAIFAAGCFWGVQHYFNQVPGVLETEVGYTGGKTKNPTYEEVCYYKTGHAEAIRILYNPQQISYPNLLKHFFRMHDPTQKDRQGPDIGSQYRSAILFLDEKQQIQAESAISELRSIFSKPIVTELREFATWWPAEDYHQNFAERTGQGACHVRYQDV